MKRFIAIDSKIFSEGFNTYCISIYVTISMFKNAHGECFPSRKTIAKYGGFSVSTYNKYIKTIIANGYIRKQERWRENGSQTSNLFTVSDIKANTVFLNSDITKKGLTANELVVLIFLCSKKNSKNKCFISQKDIAKACGMSVRTVSHIVNKLKQKKIIKTCTQCKSNNGNYILAYTICLCLEKSEEKYKVEKSIIENDFECKDVRDNILCGIIKIIR